MNHEIHDPVLIATETGFEFGVIESITTTTDKNGDRTVFCLCVYGEDEPLAWADTEISELERPTAYDYSGMKKAIVAHPGYKWALAESERRLNPPEPVSADAPAVALESPHA